MHLHYNSLYAILDDKFKRVSFEGPIKDHGYSRAASILKDALIEYQAYEMLHVLTHQVEEVEKLLVIFVKPPTNEPIIFEKKEWYSVQEYNAIANIAEIPIEKFEELLVEFPVGAERPSDAG